MTPKALWIACLVLGVLVVITSVWISACFLRIGGRQDLRSRLLAASTTTWIIVYGVAIYFSSLSAWPSTGAMLATVVLFLLSLILQWGAVRAHGKQPPAFAFIESAPVSFVRSGPYALIRHPLYSAYLLALAGGALLAADYWYWLLLSVPWVGSFYYTAAAGEERSFRDSPFAAEYEAYRAGTGMFLPKPWLLCCGCGTRRKAADAGQTDNGRIE